ncbi:unnamed protein product [Oreochromis niloticus]|nr:unnamed protein product [Mustela putorius furo]
MSLKILSITLLLLPLLCSPSQEDSARPGKKGPCCVDVTKNDMSPEVVGQTYDEQAARPPCVKAILLNTKKGQLCADPDAQWVKDLIGNMSRDLNL